MITIKEISQEGEELEIIRHLFKEYLQELGEDLTFQSCDEETQNPLKKYNSANSGLILLAYMDQKPARCVALKSLENGICEMKRLYIKPNFRKYGIGKLLVKEICTKAEIFGYKVMRLDTLERLSRAINLYEKLGFAKIDAYYHNPLPHVVYMEKQLLEAPIF